MNQTNPSIKEYLERKGVEYREVNGELIAKCLFNNCDEDSKGVEAHLYFDLETGQYDCKKCGEKGNLTTLMKFFGDKISDRTNSKPVKEEAFNIVLVDTCHKALPEKIRSYLNNRGIADEVINDYQIGYGEFRGKFWITIPIKNEAGDFVYFKLRQDPEHGNQKTTYPGGSSEVYDWDTFKNGGDILVVCEGELDKLLLTSQSVPAITGTHGAMTFSEGWVLELINFEKVYLCYDRDEAGDKGAERIIKIIQNHNLDIELYRIQLPDDVGAGGDITDYFAKPKSNLDTFFNLAKPVRTKPQRVIQVKSVANPISIDEWRETIGSNFPELLFPAEMGMSVVAQILINDITNPFALVYIDVPSSGKTITINFFDRIEGLTYATDKFSPASFVSNASNVKPEKLPEIDLLPKLQYKTFLLRDLATLFSKNDTDLTESLGTLTRVLDGEGLNTDTGVHGGRHYEGEYLFMLLAASTPISNRVWKVMGSLGSRLFFLRMNTPDKTETQLANQIASTPYKVKEKICRKATNEYLLGLWHKFPNGLEWDKSKDDIEILKIISKISLLLARMRGVINLWEKRNAEGEFNYLPPIIEKPDRINQLLYNLARGHALISGRTQLNEDDLRYVIELAIDSPPNTRALLFRRMLDKKGSMTTDDVMEAFDCSRPTALKEMEALKILKVCHLEDHPSGKPGQPMKLMSLVYEFQWFMSEECIRIRKVAPAISSEPTNEKEASNDSTYTVDEVPY